MLPPCLLLSLSVGDRVPEAPRRDASRALPCSHHLSLPPDSRPLDSSIVIWSLESRDQKTHRRDSRRMCHPRRSSMSRRWGGMAWMRRKAVGWLLRARVWFWRRRLVYLLLRIRQGEREYSGVSSSRSVVTKLKNIWSMRFPSRRTDGSDSTSEHPDWIFHG